MLFWVFALVKNVCEKNFVSLVIEFYIFGCFGKCLAHLHFLGCRRCFLTKETEKEKYILVSLQSQNRQKDRPI